MPWQEEVEAPFQSRISTLEDEVDKYKDMFFNVRREHELVKTQFEQYTVDTEAEAETARKAADSLATALREQVGTPRDSIHIFAR